MAAYELAEAPLEWYLTCHDTFTKLGGVREVTDECVWICHGSEGRVMGSIMVMPMTISLRAIQITQNGDTWSTC